MPIPKIRQDTATGILYCFHFRLKTSVDLLFKSQDLLESLENGVALILILTITERNFNPQDKDILALLVRLGGACALQIQVMKQVGARFISQSDNVPS